MGFWDRFKRKKNEEFIPQIRLLSEYGTKEAEPKIELPSPLPSKWEKFKEEQEKFQKVGERKKRKEDLT
jgi:hypothetical protein